MNFFLLIITIIVGIAIIVKIKPFLVWPFLAVISIFFGGLLISGYPLMTENFPLADEYLVIFLLIGLIFKKTAIEKKDIIQSRHSYIFLAFVIYMIFESLRGFLIWNNLNTLRWAVFYIILGLLFIILYHKPFDRSKMLVLICFSSLFYFIFYLLHGIYSGLFRNINWASLQGKEWTGGSYATFPIVIAVLSSFLVLRDKSFSPRAKLLALFLLIICLICGLYFESRISLVIFAVFFILFIFKSESKKIAPYLLIVLATAVIHLLFSGGIARNIKDYSNVFIGTMEGKHDFDRFMHLKSSVLSVNENWKTFFFGYGIYSHHYVMVPYLQKFSNARLEVEGPIITEGFMALLTDAGWIGVILFSSIFICAGKEIISKKNDNTIFILIALIALFFWMFITNLNDFLLFYILIMPGGMLALLNSYDS